MEGKTFLSSQPKFEGAFNVQTDFYIDNGKVKFGPMEPGFKSYLELMNKRYKEKLLDSDFASSDRKSMDNKVLNNKAGAFYGLVLGHESRYLAAKKDTKFDLVAAQFPVLKKGDQPKFLRRT